MNKIVILPIMFLLAISVFTPALAEPTESDTSYFTVLPNRNYGIAVNIHLVNSNEYDSLLVVVGVEDQQSRYIIEVGISQEKGIIFTEPTPLGYEAEPNTEYLVMVTVEFDDFELVGAVSIQTNEYATVSSPIKTDLFSQPN